MKNEIDFNLYASEVGSARHIGSTRVYGCECESSYCCRTFILPKTPYIIINPVDLSYADLLNMFF